MIPPPSANETSAQWIQTIDSGEGYHAIDTSSMRRFLRGMKHYAFFRAVLRYLRPGQTTLEAGCGWALTSFALAERGFQASALDIAPRLVADLERVRQELGGGYGTHLRAVVGDIFQLPALGQRFNMVLSDGTYEHFLDPQDRRRILESIDAVLVPGGTVAIAVPNLHNIFFHTVVDERMPAMYPFTLASLTAELAAHGFQTLETGYAFVNPGFSQWVTSRWMIGPIHVVNAVFRFLPRPLQHLLAAHLYCVAQKSA